ncbi:hypothetical protein FACS1894160_3570 [Bacteroidia bacterium]|nr:hypothetical protein FACS1894123_06280 [Bacteroidia bacterium]GHV08746.1 hypothetical protein FACS1894160_3570 [Bacteroidia bacterium]
MPEIIYKYTLSFTHKFKKDVKLAEKRNLDLSLLNEVIDILQQNGTLPEIYKAHSLKGKYHNIMECHIQPDLF